MLEQKNGIEKAETKVAGTEEWNRESRDRSYRNRKNGIEKAGTEVTETERME